ncbi:MAG: molecular chaperone TorD family protein [Sphingomonadales bacterium]
MKRTQLIPAYRVISELFLYPEDRDEARIGAAMKALAGAPKELRNPLETFLATPAASDTAEYVATLELSPPVPLYLGAYLFDEPKSCRGAGISGRNGYMLELANIYRHFGVEFAGREMADFVPVVVEFLAVSLERRGKDRIGLRRYLVETLLIKGLESLLSALRKHESPYALLIDALKVALAKDIALMAKGPKWRPPADVEGVGQGAPPCARGMAGAIRLTQENGAKL